MAADSTREKIIGVAERLFADRGVDRVSLAEINSLAGQRNASAVHYHFKGKDGLVEAILERHRTAIDDERVLLLSRTPAETDRSTIERLIRVLVDPLLAQLDSESGRCFLRIQSQDIPTKISAGPGIRQLLREIAEAVGHPMSPAQTVWHRRFISALLNHALAERAREEDGGATVVTERADFASTLRAAILGVVTSDPDPHGD